MTDVADCGCHSLVKGSAGAEASAGGLYPEFRITAVIFFSDGVLPGPLPHAKLEIYRLPQRWNFPCRSRRARGLRLAEFTELAARQASVPCTIKIALCWLLGNESGHSSGDGHAERDALRSAAIARSAGSRSAAKARTARFVDVVFMCVSGRDAAICSAHRGCR